MTELLIELVSVVLQIIVAVCFGLLTKHVIPWLHDIAIPWLKEKHLYNLICYFVSAAEKQAETGAIDKAAKKEYVIKLLKGRKVEVTPEVDAMIESAVFDLDMAVAGVFDTIYDVFENQDDKNQNTENSEVIEQEISTDNMSE